MFIIVVRRKCCFGLHTRVEYYAGTQKIEASSGGGGIILFQSNRLDSRVTKFATAALAGADIDALMTWKNFAMMLAEGTQFSIEKF